MKHRFGRAFGNNFANKSTKPRETPRKKILQAVSTNRNICESAFRTRFQVQRLFISFSNAIGGNIVQISRNSLTLLVGAAASALILSACGGGSSSPSATITWTAPATGTVGTSIALSASGAGTGAVSFTSATTSICTVSASNLTFVASGVCTVKANQTGATEASKSITALVENFEVDHSSGLGAWGGALPDASVSAPSGGEGKALKIVKGVTVAGSVESWGGAYFSTAAPIGFSASNKAITGRVYSSKVGATISLKVETGGQNPTSVEAISRPIAAANTWQTVTWDLGAIDTANSYVTIAITPNKLVDVPVGGEETYYIDDLAVAATPVPASLASAPTVDPSKAISVYSDAFTATANVDMNPNWGQSGFIRNTELTISGGKVRSLGSFNYQGIGFDSVDLSTFTKLHIDLWSPNATAVKVYVISAGKDTESFTVPISNANTWVSQDIDLSTYSQIVKGAVVQIKLESVPFDRATSVYLDNLYFWKP